jgi:hypothetical protein
MAINTGPNRSMVGNAGKQPNVGVRPPNLMNTNPMRGSNQPPRQGLNVGPSNSMMGMMSPQQNLPMTPMPPVPMRNPSPQITGVTNPSRGIPFGQGGFIPPPMMGPQMGGMQTGGLEPMPPQNMPIDVAPSGYTDPNAASIPGISMGTMGGQGATGMGGLRNAYAGAGPNLSTQPFKNKLFY